MDRFGEEVVAVKRNAKGEPECRAVLSYTTEEFDRGIILRLQCATSTVQAAARQLEEIVLCLEPSMVDDLASSLAKLKQSRPNPR